MIKNSVKLKISHRAYFLWYEYILLQPILFFIAKRGLSSIRLNSHSKSSLERAKRVRLVVLLMCVQLTIFKPKCANVARKADLWISFNY